MNALGPLIVLHSVAGCVEPSLWELRLAVGPLLSLLSHPAEAGVAYFMAVMTLAHICGAEEQAAEDICWPAVWVWPWRCCDHIAKQILRQLRHSCYPTCPLRRRQPAWRQLLLRRRQPATAAGKAASANGQGQGGSCPGGRRNLSVSGAPTLEEAQSAQDAIIAAGCITALLELLRGRAGPAFQAATLAVIGCSLSVTAELPFLRLACSVGLGLERCSGSGLSMFCNGSGSVCIDRMALLFS